MIVVSDTTPISELVKVGYLYLLEEDLGLCSLKESKKEKRSSY